MTDLEILWSKKRIGRVPADVKKKTVKILNALIADKGYDAAVAEVVKVTKVRKATLLQWAGKRAVAPKAKEVTLTVNGVTIKGELNDIAALIARTRL